MLPIRTLLVDDSLDFLNSAADYLATRSEVEVVGRARSGYEAINQVAALHPDLVLMDLAMPGMTGLEATRSIKAGDSAPQVIILTLHDNAEYRQATAAVGADAFLPKSEFGDRLIALIQSLIPVVAGAVAGEEVVSMKHILVIDDSATMRRMVMASLSQLGQVRFLEAATGLQAIEHLALAPVDLMVLDLNMPDMHGLEVLQFTRNHSTYRSIPIIVLTTRGDEASRTAVMAAGGSVYLTKPFQPAELAQQASAMLEKV
jgi:two-component system, chemotaxis family, chemotaxis protein CheY